MKIVIRIIASPFVFFLVWISFTYQAFKRAGLFILHGGEFLNYEKDDKVVMKMIYEELKKQNK